MHVLVFSCFFSEAQLTPDARTSQSQMVIAGRLVQILRVARKKLDKGLCTVGTFRWVLRAVFSTCLFCASIAKILYLFDDGSRSLSDLAAFGVFVLSLLELGVAGFVLWSDVATSWIVMTSVVVLFAFYNLIGIVFGLNECKCFGQAPIGRDFLLTAELVFLAGSLCVIPDLRTLRGRAAEVACGRVLSNGKVVGFFAFAVIFLVVPVVHYGLQWAFQIVSVSNIRERKLEVLSGSSEVRLFSAILSNKSSSPVRIVGAKTSCRCVSFLDNHVEIAPGGFSSIDFSIKPTEKDGRFHHSVKVYLDSDVQQSITFDIRG